MWSMSHHSEKDISSGSLFMLVVLAHWMCPLSSLSFGFGSSEPMQRDVARRTYTPLRYKAILCCLMHTADSRDSQVPRLRWARRDLAVRGGQLGQGHTQSCWVPILDSLFSFFFLRALCLWSKLPSPSQQYCICLWLFSFVFCLALAGILSHSSFSQLSCFLRGLHEDFAAVRCKTEPKIMENWAKRRRVTVETPPRSLHFHGCVLSRSVWEMWRIVVLAQSWEIKAHSLG